MDLLGGSLSLLLREVYAFTMAFSSKESLGHGTTFRKVSDLPSQKQTRTNMLVKVFNWTRAV